MPISNAFSTNITSRNPNFILGDRKKHFFPSDVCSRNNHLYYFFFQWNLRFSSFQIGHLEGPQGTLESAFWYFGRYQSENLTCHTKCAEKSVKTMTSYQEKFYSPPKIKNWKTYKFWSRIWKCHQIQLLTTFCNQKMYFVVFQLLCIKQ